jgi:tRNA nucleotidyltransferase/poly(A) polymerase
MHSQLPSYVNRILQLLNDHGFEAYVVGGAVRDLLLGLDPGDFDITTNARPEEVLQLAKQQKLKTVEKLGQNYGVVMLIVEGVPVEVATYRGERYGTDSHRPAEVWYCDKLEEDLSRRDFTVNAMALDARGQIYDFYGGREDLQKKVLRTVGEAKIRYGEDALRMYRACRLVGQLDFSYEGTLPFDVTNCRGLSVERVRTELDKLLISQAAGRGLRLFMDSGLVHAWCKVSGQGLSSYVPVLPELLHLCKLPQNSKFHCYDAWEHTLHALDNGPRELDVRWALLLHDIAKGLPGIRKPNKEGQPSDYGHEAKSADMAKIILERLGYGEPLVRRVVWLVSEHMRFTPMLFTGEKTLRHWVRTEATGGQFRSEAELARAFTQLKAVFLADMGATWAGVRQEPVLEQGRQLADEVVALAKGQMPVHTADLQVKGGELLKLVPPEQKKQVGVLLRYLLERVQAGSLPNEKTALLEAVKKRLERGVRPGPGGDEPELKDQQGGKGHV